MSNELITTTPRPLAARISDEVAGRVSRSTADNTKRAYRADWSDFVLWCDGAGRASMPASAETVAEYMNHLANAGAKYNTLKRRIVSISAAHRAQGHETPTASMLVRKVMQGIRRDIGTEANKKHAITIKELHAMIQNTPDDLRGLRDRAILTFHFAGAFRRSEVCALTVERVRFGATKTDQEGQGATKILSASDLRVIDPVASLRAWLDAAGITEGALFRRVDKHGKVGRHALTGEAIAQVWKAAATRAGLDAKEIAGHSARRGFITAAYESELSEADIMQHTGHKSPTIMRGYREDSGVASRKVSRVVLNG
jgi:site-specific recombinase XerD